jgi:hypothetical protein
LADEIKKMSVDEFVDVGYLQEVNRLWFHERGLALAVSRPVAESFESWLDETTQILMENVEIADSQMFERLRIQIEALLRTLGFEPGKRALGYIWDCRDDPEGVRFGPGVLSREKAENVRRDRAARIAKRHDRLGYVNQPLPEAE